MANNNPEKELTAQEAAERTEWERHRLFSYDKLRYSFSPWSVDQYYSDILRRRSVIYRPQKAPSQWKSRKKENIGFFQWLKSRFDKEEKRKIDAAIQKSQKQLQQEVDEANEKEYERCQRVNKRVRQETDEQHELFLKGNPSEVHNYFTTVVGNDDYSLDNQERYGLDFCLEYDSKLKRILIDYRMPRPYDVSDIKEWKSTKDFDVVEKKMTKKEFAQLYEKILFDLVVRVSALIFESDTENMVAEVLFNASTVYEENPDRVSFFLSVVIPKKSYMRQDIKNYGFVSKQFVGQMKQVKYLDDIHKEAPPSMLTDTPPMEPVVPIRTLLHD